MPSDQELQDIVEDWKRKGNEAFGKSEPESAVQAYSQGLVQVDRIVSTPLLLKAALLSNRAACYLKQAKLQECMDDCTSALTILDKENDTKLRAKLMYRRGKACYVRANMPHKKTDDDLNNAAKDMLTLLSFDSSNKEATQLLNTIRAQHAVEKRNSANTPLGKTLEAIKKKDDKMLHNVKICLGILTNDNSQASMELGRLRGVDSLLEAAKDESVVLKARYLALQCLSCAGMHPPFCRTFMKEADVQTRLSEIMVKSSEIPEEEDLVIGALTVYLRLILHLDRDDPKKEIDGSTFLQNDPLIEGLVATFKSRNLKIIRCAADVLSTWTAGEHREAVIRVSLDGFIDLPILLSKYEVQQMKPKGVSDWKMRRHHKKTRDQAWAFERSTCFCRKGGLEMLLKCAVLCDEANLRREITVIMGKVLAALDADQKIKDATGKYFGYKEKKEKEEKKDESNLGVVIEEIDDDEEEGKVVDVKEEEKEEKLEKLEDVSMDTRMERAALVTALLMAKPEVGAWSMGSGWPQCRETCESLAESDIKTALCLVAELLSAAASLKETRPTVGEYLSSPAMKALVSHSDLDVRTAAASAIAKLGLAEKMTEDIEVIGLLEAACYMLEDGGVDSKNELLTSKVPESKTGATTALERGIEVMAYLASKTMVKEELAYGFKAMPESEHTGLELLVKAADTAGAGAAVSAFGLASTFQLMAATGLTLRKEAFEGKQVTMEQYDEIQSMQKTQEDKEFDDDREIKDDTPEQCSDRIARMAAANVPRALIQLLENASDQTLEQVILALNRMADEPAVRGSMIQQGVLSGMIKVDKEEKAPSDIRKKILRMLRHCIGKMLITMNPSLLTSAQSMGSIKPMISLIRDVDSTDLQQFESLMALTNIASVSDAFKNKIVAERGIVTFKFAMFSEHELVRKAATEALCNLVPNEKFMKSLQDDKEMRLWLSLASDFEDHFECARAAAGCLAMATCYPEIADTLIQCDTFKNRMDETLECGSLEIMHRMLVVIQNLVELGGKYREAALENQLVAFARVYVESYHDGGKSMELDFGEQDMGIFNGTVDVAKKIVLACDS
jgi:hypothetical protein